MNNINKAQKYINCYLKNNPSPIYTCYGATGPTGPTGPAASITIGTVTTGNPGTNASVTNSGTDTNAILNFTIPEGEAGTSIIPAFAYLYNTSNEPINLTANVVTPLVISNVGPSETVNVGTPNKLIIEKSGTYKIDYYFSATSINNANITLEVRNNGDPINASIITKSVTPGNNVTINGSLVDTLNPNEEIDLSITTDANTTLTPITNTNTYLIINKINN